MSTIEQIDLTCREAMAAGDAPGWCGDVDAFSCWAAGWNAAMEKIRDILRQEATGSAHD